MKPRSGKAGSPVSPAQPASAEDADDADVGEVAKLKAEQAESGKGKYGATPTKPHKPSPEKKSWIEIELVDEADNPVPGERYRITLPDGTTVAEGSLDERGFARVEGFDPGTCKVTFPELDKAAWEKI